MTDKQIEVELELASMALNAGHFAEAEESFLKLIREEPDSSSYWCGLAQARYGRIITGERGFHEVFHCFTKAKELSPNSQEYIEWCIVDSSTEVQRAIYQLFFQIHRQKQEQQNRNSNHFLLGLSSAYFGSSYGNQNLYGSMMMAYTTIISIEGILDGRETLAELKQKERELTAVVERVRWNVERHVTVNKKQREAFFKETRELQQALGEEVLRSLK